MCLGDELARMMLHMFVSGILLKFKVSLCETEGNDMEGECGITLTPKDHFLIFQERK